VVSGLWSRFNVCDMEYELEDDAGSHHNIRVEPQTEFEETGADVVGVGKETGSDAVVEGDETGADGVGVGKETGVDAEVEGDEAEADGVVVDKETGVRAEGEEAGADGVAVDKKTGVRAEGDEVGADGVVVDKETGADAVGEGDETRAEAHEAVGGEERNEDETDSNLVYVSVHYEDNLWEGNGEEDSEDDDLEFDGSDHVNMRDRGLSDDGWESYDMYSDDPSSDDSLASRSQCKANFGTFKMPKSMAQYHWEVGTYFPNKEAFIEAIRTYGVQFGRRLKLQKNDKRRCRVICLGGKGKCYWFAYCAYMA